MKATLKVFVVPLGVILILALIAAVPPPPSTDFTRGFMRVTNQAEAQTYLGTSGGGSGDVTNVYNTTIITNSFFVSGKGNTLVITQQLTLQAIKTNLLSTDASGNVTTTKFGANISWDPATQTISASGGGGTSPSYNLLTQSGTNAGTIDFSGIGNHSVWYITASNNLFFGTPSNIPTNPFTFYVFVRQPSTGTCFVTWTNGTYGFSGGSTNGPISDTNGNHMDIWTFIVSPFTNSQIMGVLTPDTRL